MKTLLKSLCGTFAVIVAAAALVSAGCTESTSRKDVTKAQQDLDKARQNTQEAAQQGQQNVADVANKQGEPREHMVAKPVTPDQNNNLATPAPSHDNSSAEDCGCSTEGE